MASTSSSAPRGPPSRSRATAPISATPTTTSGSWCRTCRRPSRSSAPRVSRSCRSRAKSGPARASRSSRAPTTPASKSCSGTCPWMPEHDLLLPPGAGLSLALGGLGVRYILRGESTEGRFALIEHPLAPGTLGGPLHTHAHEDEFSFVLEGRIGMQLGDETFVAEPGAFVRKP